MSCNFSNGLTAFALCYLSGLLVIFQRNGVMHIRSSGSSGTGGVSPGLCPHAWLPVQILSRLNI
jgi:hypothetical protein